MRLKKLIAILFLINSLTLAQAQVGEQIKGTVSDEEGSPIPGVTIMEEGTGNGTISDMDGKFSIKLSNENASLKFSFIGYEQLIVPVGSKKQIKATLKERVNDLDEVVVIGYGEVRKRDLTGSISSVKVEDEIARQYPSVDLMLQGRTPGVQIIGNAGSPGAAVSVRIRGTSSLRGNNEPLYVVDGIIISTAGSDVNNPSTDANELQSAQSGLTGLNPQDIESIRVLKDASATAIYGSRGANGVVLITTKSGTSGEKANINVYGSMEYNIISKKLDLLNATNYALYQNERSIFEGGDPKYAIDGGNVYRQTWAPDPDSGEDVATIGTTPIGTVNWQDEIYQPSISYNAGLTINGGSEKSKFYFSGSFADQQGIVETTNIKRGDIRLNYNRKLNDRIMFDTRTSMMYQEGTFAQGGSKSGGSRSFTKQILTYRPLMSNEGEDDDLDLEVSNPYAWLSDFDDISEEIRVNNAISFNIELANGLKHKISTGLDYRKKDRTKFYGTEVFVGQKENGLANYSYLTRIGYSIDNILTYNKRFKKKHSITAMAGVTYDGIKSNSHTYEVANFPDKSLGANNPQGGQSIYRPLTLDPVESAIFSVLSRLNYSYKNKYILTGTYRADQSTKFQEDNKWGYFPSFATAWRIMEEPFIKRLGIFHNLKLRAGWGQTGNQAIRPYQTLSTYSTVYYVNNNNSSIVGNATSRIPNKNLKWETAEQLNAGLDMAFFKGRLSATIDMYKKNTRDLLQEVDLGPSNGFQTVFINRGGIENQGLEIGIDGVLIEKNDMSLSVGGNIAFNRNKIVDLGLPKSSVWKNGEESSESFYFGNGVSTGTYFKQPANIFMENKPIGMFWGWETQGIYQDADAAIAGPTFNGNSNRPGDVIMVDQNQDGNIDEADKTFIGNPNPDFVYGFNLNFQYKNFTVSALLEGVYGSDIINANNMELGYAEAKSTNIRTEVFEQAWRPDAPSNTYPRIGYDYNEFLTDRIVEDGSYLRLSNLTVGYNIPTGKNKIVKQARIYATGRNLFTLTNYSGYDPQVTSFLYDGNIMGVDWVGNPNVRSFLVGINLKF